MLHIFNPLTTDAGGTWLLLGEYGALTAVVGLSLAILFWYLRNRLPEKNTMDLQTKKTVEQTI